MNIEELLFIYLIYNIYIVTAWIYYNVIKIKCIFIFSCIASMDNMDNMDNMDYMDYINNITHDYFIKYTIFTDRNYIYFNKS